MQFTVSYTEKDVEALIRADLAKRDLEVEGALIFSVRQGYSDPRESSSPGLNSVTAKVKTRGNSLPDPAQLA